MNIRPNIGGCMHCGHDHFTRECLTCRDTDGPCRAMLQWEVKVLGTSLTQKVEMLSAHVEPPEPQPDLDATIKSLRDTIEGLKNQLDDARQTERDLDAEVAKLTHENTWLAKLAWEAQQKVEALEADNKALRVSGTELKALYDERLDRYETLARGVADELEKLGFNVFRPGQDVCDND